MAKNSFSLVETVLALIILSILVSGFLQFTYVQTNRISSVNQTKNLLLENLPHPNLSTHFFTYEKTSTTLTLQAGNSITQTLYQDDFLKLVKYQLNHIKAQNIDHKVFE